MSDLDKDQKKKFQILFKNKEFSKIIFEIESLGKLEFQPNYILFTYASAIAADPNSKKDDLEKSARILDQVYSSNKDDLQVLFNLISVCLKIKEYSFVLDHLINQYNKGNKDKKILESLGIIYYEKGNIINCVKFLKELYDLNPNLYSSSRLMYLLSLNYLSGISQRKYFEEVSKIQNAISKSLNFETFKFSRVKKTKIKLGFYSGNLANNHPASRFFKDLLLHINKNQFEIYIFNNLKSSQQDKTTEDLKKISAELNWKDISGYKDEKQIDFIRSLNLDILFDLNGFTEGAKLSIFAARCAPVQISWLGYNNSTGLNNMDYLLCDRNLIKEDEKKYYSEKVIFFPKIWCSLDIPKQLPKINSLSRANDKRFIFGSFNNFNKISIENIKVWSEILNNSNSNLYLINASIRNKDMYEKLRDDFEKNNINLKNVNFLEPIKFWKHLEYYNQIDISLDTFPFPGVTSTFDSYLMGVPVLTMKGFNFYSRCGESINKNLELNNFIAKDKNDYIQKAITFSKNNFNSDFRNELRKRVLKSNLFDIKGFASEFTFILKNLHNKMI